MHRIILQCQSNKVSPPCASFGLWHVLNALTVANCNIILFTALYHALKRCSCLCCKVNWLKESTPGDSRRYCPTMLGTVHFPGVPCHSLLGMAHTGPAFSQPLGS